MDQIDHHKQGEQHKQEACGKGRDPADTRRAGGAAEQELAGKIRLIKGKPQRGAVNGDVNTVEHVADDFAEGKGHNGQVVTLQPEHRNANQETRDSCQYAAGHKRKHQLCCFRHAEGLPGIGGNHNACKCADRHEAGMTQTQLAGNTDGQIQGNCHHDVNANGNQQGFRCSRHIPHRNLVLAHNKCRDHDHIGKVLLEQLGYRCLFHGSHLTPSRGPSCQASRWA